MGAAATAFAPRRAPEILLGQEAYTEAVDMWAAGCIFGELLRNEPLFPAKAEADMLELIARLLGAPSERIWPVRAPRAALEANSGAVAASHAVERRAGVLRRSHKMQQLI